MSLLCCLDSKGGGSCKREFPIIVCVGPVGKEPNLSSVKDLLFALRQLHSQEGPCCAAEVAGPRTPESRSIRCRMKIISSRTLAWSAICVLGLSAVPVVADDGLPLAARPGDAAIVVPHGRSHAGDVQRRHQHRHQPTCAESRYRAEEQRSVQQQDQDQPRHEPVRLRALLALRRAERPAARPRGEAQAGRSSSSRRATWRSGTRWKRPTVFSKTASNWPIAIRWTATCKCSSPGPPRMTAGGTTSPP